MTVRGVLVSRQERITSDTCRRCGLCCVSPHDQDSFCDVEEADIARLDPKWVRRNVLGFRPFDVAVAALSRHRLPEAVIATRQALQRRGPLAGMSACTCVALRGSLLHRTSCSIYDRRPRTCRDAVKPGDPTCRELRKMYADIRTGDL